MAFPYHQQLEAMDCGAACLRMVARYHGRYYSLEYLRERTHISRDGVNLAGISDGAEAIGMQSLALVVTLDQLRDEIPLPCILPWGDDHFVVLHKIKGDRFYVANPDPSVGMSRYSTGELMANWPTNDAGEGTVLVLETTPAFYTEDQEGVDKSSFRYVLSYIGKYRRLLYQLLAGLILGCVLQIMLPFLLKNLVDVGIVYDDRSFIVLVIVAQGVLFLTLTAIASLRRWILLHIGGRVNISLISDFLSKMTRLPMPFFHSRMGADLLQRINDHERLQRFLTGQTLMSVFSFVNFLAFGIVLAMWSQTILLVFLVGTALHLAWLFFFQLRRRDLDHRRFDQSSVSQGQLMEIIGGMSEIKLYGAERQKRWAWERNQARLYRTGLQLMYVDQMQRTGSSVLNEGKNLVITFLAATAVLDNRMSIGMLVAIHYILAQLNTVISDFAEFMRSYQESKISLERMNEIHNKADEDKPEERLGIVPDYGNLVIRDLDFQYTGPQSPKILKSVNVTIPRGKVTAIVGSSGSGKSTLLKILMGFYQPTTGKVELGSSNLHAIEVREWRKQISVVMQDGFLFSDTIARNIALGDEIVDQQRLLNAVRIARIQTFIESLPMGYKTPVGEKGMGLSQGQKQRLLIARAIYKDPQFLFLDEATTGLNAFTEVLIMDELLEYFEGRTVVIVAHRHTTIQRADQIIVLESGEVVEHGKHEELMFAGASYYRLVQNQKELGN
ncbi:MAG: peptidase domain-containing ABC transporter [Bacteroidota bacterium]